MAVRSPDDIRNARRSLKKPPLPKVPLSPSSSQGGVQPPDSGFVSVSEARNKFEQDKSSTKKGHGGTSLGKNGDDSKNETVLSVASARARFEGKTIKKNPPCVVPSKKPAVDVNSNVKTEPRRRPLPPLFRIGPAPRKPAKPVHLRLLLARFKNKVVHPLHVGSHDQKNNIEGLQGDQSEDVYDDVESVLPENAQDGASEDIYDDVKGVLGNGRGYHTEGELYECVDSSLGQEEYYEAVEKTGWNRS